MLRLLYFWGWRYIKVKIARPRQQTFHHLFTTDVTDVLRQPSGEERSTQGTRGDVCQPDLTKTDVRGWCGECPPPAHSSGQGAQPFLDTCDQQDLGHSLSTAEQ